MQGKTTIETRSGNEEASLAKVETTGSGPTLGKRGITEGTNSSKKGKY